MCELYSKKLTSLISLCCCKLCTVGCAVLVAVIGELNVGVFCGFETFVTGVLLTGGCCFFLNESYKILNKTKNPYL